MCGNLNLNNCGGVIYSAVLSFQMQVLPWCSGSALAFGPAAKGSSPLNGLARVKMNQCKWQIVKMIPLGEK